MRRPQFPRDLFPQHALAATKSASSLFCPAADTLGKGLVWAAIGLGLAGAYLVFKTSGIGVSDETRNWFLFFGVISPAATLYGVANVVHYQMTKTRRAAATSGRDQVR